MTARDPTGRTIHRLTALLVVGALSATLGCSTAAPAVQGPPRFATTQDCPESALPIEFSFARRISEDERAELRELTEAARDYFQIRTNACRNDPPIEVTVMARSKGWIVAEALGERRIGVYARSLGWLYSSHGDRASVLVHEMLHLMQEREGGTFYLAYVPDWFIEGSAEWIGARGATDLGYYTSFSQPRERQLKAARSATVTIAEWYREAPYGYPLAFAAVDMLVTQEAGKETLLGLFYDLGQGIRWEEAFRKAFGMNLKRFQREFADYRASGFRR